MDRAYAVLEIKSASEDGGKRTFKGIATTPSTDRVGDIVEPDGAQFKLPLPLLYQHDSGQPIGWVKGAKVSKSGIDVECEIADIDEDGPLKTRLLEAWQSIKSKLVRGLSIGFKPLESSQIKDTWNYRYIKWEWLELSAVTIPANQDCTILAIKSIDEQQRAALGKPPDSKPPPGVSGTSKQAASRGFSFSRKEPQMKTISEQITDLEASRQAKTARMAAIMQKAMDEGRSTDQAEGEEYDGLESEVTRADDDLKRLRNLERLNAATLKPVNGNSEHAASQSRAVGGGGPMILRSGRDQDEKFAGQNFTRKFIAQACSYIERRPATQIAMERGWHKTNPTLVEIIKVGEVPGGGTGSGEWGAELATADARFTGDFIEYLYGMTVFDRLPLQEIPENVVIPGQDGASTAYWVGESKAIPATTADFFNVTLTGLEVDALAVISKKLIRTSSPSAELLVRNSLAEASAQRIDTTFFSTAAAVAGVSPAGLLNGLTGLTPAGTDADSVRADINALFQTFVNAKNAKSGLVIVTTPALAGVIGLMVNALGQAEFPGMANDADARLQRYPVLMGDNVPAGAVIMLRPSDIYKIGDSGLRVEVSGEATIEQSTVPTGATDTPVAASQAMTNMFQSNSLAIKVTRVINFAKRRASAAAFVTGAAYALIAPAGP